MGRCFRAHGLADTESDRNTRAANISPDKHTSRALAYLLLLLAISFWSGNWILGRAMRADVPPIALSFWRWTVALVCLLPWAWRHLCAQRQELLRHWRTLLVLGCFGGACNSATTYIALNMTTATNGVLLAAATPIMIIALSWALLGKRLQAREWLGVLISLAGVLIIVAHGDPQTLLELRPNKGDLWVLAGFLSWSLYTVLLSRRPLVLHPYVFLAAISFGGLLALSPFYAWEIASGRTIQANPSTMAAVAYGGIFVSLLSFVFWNRAVVAVGSNIAGAFMNLMPAVGTLLAIILLGEQPQLFQLAGILFIVVGLTLTTRQRRGLSAQ